MKRMTYMSRFARPLSEEEITRLGVDASRRNADDDVTGVLLTLGSVFFQIIEGDDDAVDDLYERVLVDDRHTDIVCLRTEVDVDRRLFPDWSMNHFDLDHLGGDVVDALKLVLERMSEAQHIIERYTQPAVSRIMAQGLNPLDVPLRKVERVVLFADMVGFSALSERLSIDDLSDLVATFLDVCTTGIAAHGGEVTKFLGDGVLAYFDHHAVDEALQSCVDIRGRLEEIRDAAPPGSARRSLLSGFGVAAGPVVEGSMGSSVKRDYTIIGSPVNAAARLEALTRTLDAPILTTAAVAEAASPAWDLRVVGRHDIGHAEPEQIHALGPPGATMS